VGDAFSEEELERERRRLADAQSLAHVGSWEWDVDTDAIVVSDELARIFGHRRGDIESGRVNRLSLVHPDDRARVARSPEEALHAGESDVVYRIVRPDGEVRWVHSLRRSLPGRRVVGTIQDITEQRQAEIRVREAEALLDQTLRQAPVGIALVAPDGRVLRVNRVLCELTGHAEEDLLARPFDALLHPGDRGELREHEGEKRLLRAGGDAVWTQVSVALLRDHDGACRSFVVGIQDITERRAAAQALRESEQAAQEASRLKSQFLANMSHEIRTPMNGVLGMIDALLHSGLTAEQRSHAETARRSAESLLTIIDDVLDFSKVEAGRLELEETSFDLIDLLEETRDLLWQRAQDRGLVIIGNIEAGVRHRVVGDPVRVRQVLINLLSNAIKFSQDGVVELKVSDEGEDLLRFAVIDRGIGMDHDTLRRLFTPFMQADASTTRRFGGTGLGLAISRQLAELMGGGIGAESHPGEGSTFWFTALLPEAPDTAPEDHILAGVRVLVCAEHGPSGEALQALTARWGAETTGTTPGDAPRAQVVAAAGGAAPEVVLLADPDGTLLRGPLLGHLRERAGGPLPAVVLARVPVAADARPDDVHVLELPYRRAELGRLLARAAGRDVPDAPADGTAAPVPPPDHDEGLGRGRRILVAEDNVVNQQVARLTLQRRGFEVVVAADGAEAVEALGDGTDYDLVLMDCQMPRMDGFAATAEIRRRQAGGPPTPIIAMTASSTTEDRARCLAAGMDDFVAKPVRPDDLEAVLRRWLR